ncbi:MAG: hypothetical protein VKL39_11170 [Leptolyngbyaceae bacterium]|nr:hypothetical protein [Leptolyngbyaceae bacterium]
MNQINYTTMTDAELKRYLLANRDDLDAFHAYMDRRAQQGSGSGIAADDPEWEAKVLTLIQHQLTQNAPQ